MTDRTLMLWAVVALVLLFTRKAQPMTSTSPDGTITVQGRTLLAPGLWLTEDWQTWRRKT